VRAHYRRCLLLESFTDAAREIIVQAQVIAHEQGDHPANAAHLLVALATRPGPTSDALAAQGVTMHTIESRATPPHGGPPDPARVLGHDLLWCLTRARVEATVARDHEITDRHLGLAALDEPGVRELMQQVGSNADPIRDDLRQRP
jgi:ATP-dependent Clp protease ATP-binding subunit ClpA